MNAVVMIPTRYESTRFPGKPLVDILGESLIYRVWRQCTKCFSFKDIYVATDDDRIKKHCQDLSIQYIMTSKNCLTGTDRVAEAYKKIRKKYKTIINVQGDEPLIEPTDIEKIYEEHIKDIFTPCCGMTKIKNEEEFRNSNIIKIVTNISSNLIYASRAPIPSNKNSKFYSGFKQVCIYAFCPDDLETFSLTGKTPLEKIEDIEILRFIECGRKVKMIEVSNSSISVDIPEDIMKVEEFITRNQKENEC